MSRKWIVGTVAAGLMLAAVAARAHEGHAHKVLGTVTARHANGLEVKTRDGKTVTIALTDTTVFERGAERGDDTLVHVGERVVVDVGDGKTMTARTVKVGAAPARK